MSEIRMEYSDAELKTFFKQAAKALAKVKPMPGMGGSVMRAMLEQAADDVYINDIGRERIAIKRGKPFGWGTPGQRKRRRLAKK